MFDENMMRQINALPFVPNTLCITTTNTLSDSKFELLEKFQLANGNWGNETSVYIYTRRSKRETLIRQMAKKMASAH